MLTHNFHATPHDFKWQKISEIESNVLEHLVTFLTLNHIDLYRNEFGSQIICHIIFIYYLFIYNLYVLHVCVRWLEIG